MQTNYTPKDCIDRLVKDLKEIERDYIKQGDFRGASEVWQLKLFERHYYSMRNRIALELHCGLSVCAVAEQLVDKLKEGKHHSMLEMFRAYAAQTNLPPSSHQ